MDLANKATKRDAGSHLRGAIPLSIRMVLFHLRELWRGRREWSRLQGETRVLVGNSNLTAETTSRLRPVYEEYVSKVSSSRMAISFELSVFLLRLCHTFRPSSILDLGSGLSSVVFRTYQASAIPRPVVCSVDDSEMWLGKTCAFLTGRGMPTDNTLTWSQFVQANREVFDLVLHDLGTIDLRARTLLEAVNRTGPRGILVLDDVDRQSYASYARRILGGRGLRVYSLRVPTKDEFARYSLMGIRS